MARSGAGGAWRAAAGGETSNSTGRASASEPRAISFSGGGIGLPRSACPIERDRGSWARPPPSDLSMETLLYVEGLGVSFDEFLALNHLNLILERHERIRLLIGPNGAGKT